MAKLPFSDKQRQRICCYHICLARNTKENPSGWKEVTTDGNLNPHEEIKNTGKSNYMERHGGNLCKLLNGRSQSEKGIYCMIPTI